MAELLELLEINTAIQPPTENQPWGTWTYCSHAPGAITHPNQLDDRASEWLPAAVPGTVASALSQSGRWDMQHPPAIDSRDWWFRTTFVGPEELQKSDRRWLSFDGLATLAEVWLNGELLLTTDNMFRAHRVEVSDRLLSENELVLGFRSLTTDLQKKRPRPRWKTNLVNHQQLRWRRTTLLGRIPGWCPPAPTIGPWRDVRLESTSGVLFDVQFKTRLEGETGIVEFRASVPALNADDRYRLQVGAAACDLEITSTETGHSLTGTIVVPHAPVWWPHTHGQQPLLPCQVIIESDANQRSIDCGRVGFRQLQVNLEPQFSVDVNGQPIYCRGGCWTVSDVFTLNGTEASLRRDLILARDAGVNMLRVIGTMTYESDLFFDLCDELGIMVWQDFQFANMDYPVDDPSFSETIQTEAIEQLCRLSRHPSVTVYCGSSEVEQQAAMLGLPRELWTNHWFAETLPKLCAEHHPGAGYLPSTPTGGVLPFHASSGVTHFYGVGAYLRSPAELRQANVKFTSECLGFSNIPEPDMVFAITDGAAPAAHHPKWKQRVPRDTGAGWDFEDVRDHYLKQIYGLDAVTLRSTDMRRYLEISRVVSGEMMAQTFSEWRGSHSHNQGGLVWFYKDLWPAAGWGVVDSNGEPKAAYYFLKRSWQSRQVTLTDEGLNGLHLHLINESAEPLTGFVEVTLLKESNIVIARQEVSLNLPGRGRQLLQADEILGGFFDVSYAYRFGPVQHDVAVATLFDANHETLGQAFHFIRRRESNIVPVAVDLTVEPSGDGEYRLTLQADRFLHHVRLCAPGFRPDDNYFHLVPQRPKVIHWTATGSRTANFAVDIEALNMETPVSVSCPGPRN